MIENLHGRNYELAKAEADKVDEQIIEVLQAGHSFRVEAGAGSGKTYSLNKVIEWIQSNKWAEYSRKKQNVICITYTNAAVNVIAERLSKDSGNSIDVYTSVGYMLRIDCWEAEKNLKTTPGSDCALNALAIDEPLEYAKLYLDGNLQMWVDAEDSLDIF